MNDINNMDALIEAYRSGVIDESGRRSFEDRLRVDPNLQRALALHDELDQALKDQDAITFETVVANVVAGKTNPKEAPPPKKTTRWYILWILAAILLALLVVFFVKKTASPTLKTLYDSYYEPYTAFGVPRSNEASGNTWIAEYAAGNYREATIVLEQIETPTQLDQFYLAQSYLAQNDYDGALQVFDRVIQRGLSNVRVQSKWYKSLILLKQGKKKDVRYILKSIQHEPGKYGGLAVDLLEDLEG